MTLFAGLLDLNAGSVISLNGQPIVVRRDDFVGIKDIPSLSEDGGAEDVLQFVTVRAAASKPTSENVNKPTATASEFSTTIGFFFQSEGQHGSSFVRRYDPYTEEMSGNIIDEQTVTNLASRVQNMQMEPQRVIPYSSMSNARQQQQWKDRTKYVTKRVLERRGIHAGMKLVPGAYHEDNDEYQNINSANTSDAVSSTELVTTSSSKQQKQIPIKDGISPEYPCIPVWDAKGKFHVQRHIGTQKYLTKLAPQERTKLLLDQNPSSRLFHDVLERYYDNQWQDLVGDLQLAFTLFLHLRCFASLEHWRDLIAMVCVVEPMGLIQNSALYEALLQTLTKQVLAIENEFFEDAQVSEGNFLLTSFKSLIANLSSVSLSPVSLANFQSLLKNKFAGTFSEGDDSNDANNITNDDGEMDIYMDDNDDEDDDDEKVHGRSKNKDDDSTSPSDDEYDDEPVMITMHEMEVAMQRTDQNGIAHQLMEQKSKYSKEIMAKYPFIFSAMMPQEDIVMTCARVLDNKTDVTLVREAAAYLEEIESGAGNSEP